MTQDRDRGMTTITILLSAGVVMLLVVQLVNLLVFQYGRGAVRAALDEGVRTGARTGTEVSCEERARSAIETLAAGMSDGVVIDCLLDGSSMIATAVVSWPGWLTSVGSYNRTLSASSALENR